MPPLRCPLSQCPNGSCACVRTAVACRMRARVPFHVQASAVSKEGRKEGRKEGSGAAAASRRARETRSRHDATCALRGPICDAAAYLKETQKLDVQGIRALLHHVRQQCLLGSVAIDRDLLELQAGTALQRWMRCSCCAQHVPWQLWPMHCERRRLCARPPHRPRPYRQERPRVRVRACIAAGS